MRGSEEIVLQPREFRLLEYLMKHAGQVVTRTMLLENVWDYHFDPQTNVIDVHISRSALQDRQGLLAAAAAHRPRCRIHDPRRNAALTRAEAVSALGKLFRTTAFKLTLVYLIVFALFAAFLLGYFALNTRRLFTDQMTQAVDVEIAGPFRPIQAGGIRRLTLGRRMRARGGRDRTSIS